MLRAVPSPAPAQPLGRCLEFVLANLKILGALPKHGKLCVRGGMLAVDTAGALQPVWRWLRGDSRADVVAHIRRVVELGEQITASWITDAFVLAQLETEFRSARQGLAILVATYAGDSQVQAQLELLVSHVSAIGSRLEEMRRHQTP